MSMLKHSTHYYALRKKGRLRTRKHDILVTPDNWISHDAPVRMYAHTSVVQRTRVMAGFFYIICRMSQIGVCVKCVCACVVVQRLNRGDQVSQCKRCLQNMKGNNAYTNGRSCLPSACIQPYKHWADFDKI
jgi:hypothetical protein